MKRFPYIYVFIVTFLIAAQLEAAPTVLEKEAAIEMKQLEKKAQDKGSVRVIVELNEEVSAGDLAKLTQKLKGKKPNIHQIQEKALMQEVPVSNAATIKQYEEVPYMAMSVSKDELARLRKSRLVKDVTEDRVYSRWADAATIARSLGSDVGWNSGYTGKGQTVVIIDSGVDRNHPYLRNKVVREACFSSREEDKASGIQIITPVCRGGRTSLFGKGAADVDCRVGDVACAHGTYVALLAAGNSGAANFLGSGMAPEAKVIGIKAESNFNVGSCGGQPPPCRGFADSDLLKSLDFVIKIHRRFHVAAVNMSLGGGARNCFRDPLRKAIRKLRNERVATIISSGNDGTPYTVSQPACIPEAVSVGATNSDTHVISEFSNGARSLDLLAPGEGIVVPYFNVDPLGTEVALDGTSFSAPIVTGAWASLKSHKPKAKVIDILNVLKSTGAGILDARNATIKPEIRIDRAHNALGP